MVIAKPGVNQIKFPKIKKQKQGKAKVIIKKAKDIF
jgi:hypothetical protein